MKQPKLNLRFHLYNFLVFPAELWIVFIGNLLGVEIKFIKIDLDE